MNKITAQKILKIFGIINYIGAGLVLVLGLFFLFTDIPELEAELVKTIKIEDGSITATMVVGVGLIVYAFFEAFQGWVLRRAGKKDKTTLALVITGLSVVGSVFGLFNSTGLMYSITTLVIDVLLFYSVIVVRGDTEAK